MNKEIGRKDDKFKTRWDLIPLNIYASVENLNCTEFERDFDILIAIQNQDWVLAAAYFMELIRWDWDLVNYIYEKGAEKYAEHNWKLMDNPVRFFNALMRHYQLVGTTNDADFGGDHAAYCAWNCIALRWFELEKLHGNK